MFRLLICMAMFIACSHAVQAEETRLAIRALSGDAKFIGTGMSGMAVTVEDADTGEILDTGVTRGATGSTDRIIRTPRERYARLSEDGDAVYVSTLNIDAPRRIKVTVRGPIAQPQALGEASSTRWVLPGKHIEAGDGWLLDVPGFAVDIIAPSAYTYVDDDPETMTIVANVIMMCGCPTSPGGTWDANEIEVTAQVRYNGGEVMTSAMSHTGELSHYAVDVPSVRKGTYEILVTAFDSRSGNTGVDRASFIVR
ncbi:MAG: hypothetical protein AAGL90_12385 [Pseudomonadota bacterium]